MGLPECQKRFCGEAPLEVTPVATTFFNVDNAVDVLTIPSVYWVHIADLKDSCGPPQGDGGVALTAQLLEAGRRVHQQRYGVAPTWQCFHTPDAVGVYWLHLHSFRGERLDSESLPSDRSGSCARGDVSTMNGAREILGRIQVVAAASSFAFSKKHVNNSAFLF